MRIFSGSFCVLLCLFFLPTFSHATVYIVTDEANFYRTFFDPYCSRDEVARPFCQLREDLEKAGYRVDFTFDAADLKDVEAIIAFNDTRGELFNNLVKYPKERCFLFLFEPPVVMPQLYSGNFSPYFGKIFTMFDTLVDNKRYFKFYYPQPRLEMIKDVPDFDQKKLSAMIVGKKGSSHPNENYSERFKAIYFFSVRAPLEDFDLYGGGWDGPNAKGFAVSKRETLKNYKFSFCYENMKKQKGYITEKIFDSMVAGCVPIYSGASNITDTVPANCFIDRRKFSSYDELYLFLKQMDRKTYEQYIENIRRYLTSEEASLYSIDHFVNLIKKELPAKK